MTKKKTGELIQQISESLSRRPKSINVVASDVDTNWESAKNALETLKALGLVDETRVGNERIFRRKGPVLRAGRDDTLFGLPLTEEQERLIDFTFMEIKKEWTAAVGYPPTKTHIQKMITEVADECDLNIPRGWYKFGFMCVKNYDPRIDYPIVIPNIAEKIKKCITTVVDKCRNLSAYAIKLQQYSNRKEKLYLTKESIIKLLGNYEFNQENRSNLRHLLTEFAFAFTVKEDALNKCTLTMLNEFIATMIRIIKDNSEEELNTYRQDLVEGFNNLWDLIATYRLFDSLSKFYTGDQLQDYLGSKIETKIATVNEYLKHLEDYAEPMKIEDYLEERTLLDKFKGTLIFKKEMSKEDRKKLAEIFAEDKDKSDVFGEYDLD